MARKRTAYKLVEEKRLLSIRLREIRVEVFGDRGAPGLAKQIGIPTRSWYNYEIGVTVPAEVMLKFLSLTQAEPEWLLTGEGPKFRSAPEAVREPEVGGGQQPASASTEAILVEALRLMKSGGVRITWEVIS